MAKKKTSQLPKSDFDSIDDLDICSFTSEPTITGECISSFSFDDDSNEDISVCNNKNDTASPKAANNKIDLNVYSANTQNNTASTSFSNNNATLNDKNKLADNKKIPVANGMAPPINGEYLDTKRTYMLRSSTVRKLNELKSIHPQINTYVSTIVDIAIAHYYNHIINEGGKQ